MQSPFNDYHLDFLTLHCIAKLMPLTQIDLSRSTKIGFSFTRNFPVKALATIDEGLAPAIHRELIVVEPAEPRKE